MLREFVCSKQLQVASSFHQLCQILRSCFSSLRIRKQSCSGMEAKSAQLISAVVLSLACLASSKSCSYTCQWPDVDRALCDSRFINIFRGIVKHVTKNSPEDYVDYAVEVTGVYRTEHSGLVSEGSTVNIRTTLHEYVCPVVKMPVHFNAWFATGPLGQPQNDYRIATDSCTSFIATHLTPEVENDLRRGKFNTPC